MNRPDAGSPPASPEAYIRDMLRELACLADRIGDEPLANAIREAAEKSLEANPPARSGRRGVIG